MAILGGIGVIAPYLFYWRRLLYVFSRNTSSFVLLTVLLLRSKSLHTSAYRTSTSRQNKLRRENHQRCYGKQDDDKQVSNRSSVSHGWCKWDYGQSPLQAALFTDENSSKLACLCHLQVRFFAIKGEHCRASAFFY